MSIPEEPYGFELIMDLHGCDVSKFNRTSLREYLVELCRAINMERRDLHIWDDSCDPPEDRPTSLKTKGISAVQFIVYSSIVIHMLELLEAVYINIFSCQPFDKDVAEKLSKDWLSAERCWCHFIERA